MRRGGGAEGSTYRGLGAALASTAAGPLGSVSSRTDQLTEEEEDGSTRKPADSSTTDSSPSHRAAVRLVGVKLSVRCIVSVCEWSNKSTCSSRVCCRRGVDASPPIHPATHLVAPRRHCPRRRLPRTGGALVPHPPPYRRSSTRVTSQAHTALTAHPSHSLHNGSTTCGTSNRRHLTRLTRQSHFATRRAARLCVRPTSSAGYKICLVSTLDFCGIAFRLDSVQLFRFFFAHL